jgi:uncharacterized protein (DUF488 family)
MIKIYTIGYGNRSISKFINLLEEFEIDTIIDVRSHPISRYNTGFNKNALYQVLANVAIDYLFKGNVLGGKPKSQDFYKDGKLDYKLVNNSIAYKDAINELIELAETKNICLMCCELDPNSCHRKNLIAETLISQKISCYHINEKGLLSNHYSISQIDLF